MDRLLYVAMSGASQTLKAQAMNNHNLANATTTGFRADFQTFRAMPVFGPGHPARAYAMAERPGVDLKSGVVTATGRDLDVAIDGKGWIAVRAPDGTEAYTRAGDLRVTTAGQLVTGAGHPVLGPGGDIITLPPYEKLEVAFDGTLTIRPIGQDATALTQVEGIKLVNPPEETLTKGADGLMRGGAGVVADPNVHLIPGSLESSNVNAVEALITMMQLARQYEAQVKMMRTADEVDARSAELLRL